MPATCSVPTCASRASKDLPVSFHSFPKDAKVLKAWLENLQRVNKDGSGWQPKQSSKICSQHFKSACYQATNKRGVATGKKILLPLACPTENLNVSTVAHGAILSLGLDSASGKKHTIIPENKIG